MLLARFSKTKYAGFSLFRFDRLIQGVGENKGYRPSQIFGNPQSHSYQRIFGEIHLDGQSVWVSVSLYSFFLSFFKSMSSLPSICPAILCFFLCVFVVLCLKKLSIHTLHT